MIEYEKHHINVFGTGKHLLPFISKDDLEDIIQDNLSIRDNDRLFLITFKLKQENEEYTPEYVKDKILLFMDIIDSNFGNVDNNKFKYITTGDITIKKFNGELSTHAIVHLIINMRDISLLDIRSKFYGIFGSKFEPDIKFNQENERFLHPWTKKIYFEPVHDIYNTIKETLNFYQKIQYKDRGKLTPYQKRKWKPGNQYWGIYECDGWEYSFKSFELFETTEKELRNLVQKEKMKRKRSQLIHDIHSNMYLKYDIDEEMRYLINSGDIFEM